MLPPIALRPTAFLKLLKSFRPIRKTIFRENNVARNDVIGVRLILFVCSSRLSRKFLFYLGRQKLRIKKIEIFFFFFKDSVYFFESLRTNKRTRNRILKEVNFFFSPRFVRSQSASIDRAKNSIPKRREFRARLGTRPTFHN